ncbi:shikimate/quinate 5-dehydrogenase [Desulforamulus profundi]|uniref:Shikimate/quinate 5-dehydrogenase n=1 Tax=Desulforamulus profundi TaxID=1383067 RepID=A0A2C6LK05_9FIRM|nr:quinate 5-dehydrogenase [Desulforamulus profundi]PHJ38900.1 shikimate/quinate 5-dehydrogenase [Desulforamulus profundi]
MKKVVSVSLGSSKRNHTVRVELLGEEFEISRLGTDGDIHKAISVLKELDGSVDAIGLGGIDVYLYAGNTRYVLQDGLRLLETVKKTPVVDGSGLKNTLERQAVEYLVQQGLIKKDARVLMVSAMDRFGMAEALEKAGCRLTLGDLVFALGIPIPIRRLDKLQSIAAKLMPVVSRLPFQFIYPTGQQQDKHPRTGSNRFARYYLKAEVVAGDYHLIRKYLPEKLNGQLFLTNTTTREDVEELMERGAGMLITTTPEFQGRTFGTNVMEAVFLALLNKSWEEATVEDYTNLLKQLNWQPKIIKFHREALVLEPATAGKLG